MNRRERRSGWHARAQLDWVGDLPSTGVGARQAGPRLRAGGGGYLNECNTPELWEEAKFRELADMGLPGVWLAVAREAGYDKFMAIWRILDAAIELRSDSDSMIEVQLRRFGSFRRYQRNRFIEALANLGCTDKEIRGRVKRELGEDLSLSHIYRLAAPRRVRA